MRATGGGGENTSSLLGRNSVLRRVGLVSGRKVTYDGPTTLEWFLSGVEERQKRGTNKFVYRRKIITRLTTPLSWEKGREWGEG